MKPTHRPDRFRPGGRYKQSGLVSTDRARPVCSCQFLSEKRFDGAFRVILAVLTLPAADLW
jgi:hypothetical protein